MTEKLLSPKKLLAVAWDAESRPTRQWLAKHTPKTIPGVRIGRRWFYSLPQVMAALGFRGDSK
jgi:hypothetical protein